MLIAAGAGSDEAEIVVTELLAAELAGHPSHGLVRLCQYVRQIQSGAIRPGRRLTADFESTVIGCFRGGYGFGACLMAELLPLACARARRQGTYTAMLGECNHIGRLGGYAARAAAAGFVTMLVANVVGAPRVTPFGGQEARLGTNPICLAAPWHERVMMVDTTTSATAEGKVRVARANGQRVPPGMLIDADGAATTDAQALYSGGAILPLGGAVAYKGFGLAVMVEIIGGLLSGTRFDDPGAGTGTNGVWLYLLDLGRLPIAERFDDDVERLAAWLKAVHPAPGVEAVLMPGELEHLKTVAADRQAIPIADGTWQQLLETAQSLGVSDPAAGGAER